MASIIVGLVVSLIIISSISVVLFFLYTQNINIEVQPKKGIEVLTIIPTKVVDTYSYAIKACSGTTQLNNPFVSVSSDMETKSYRLALDVIPNNTCHITGGIIQALAKESIQFSLTSASPISQSKETENKIINLKEQLIGKNKELSKLLSTTPEPPDFDKRLVDIVRKIADIRTELKTLRA